MKAELIGNGKTVMSNPYGLHNYFAWPSVARLKNGEIAVSASGFRLAHICPFGKAVISFSRDEGETFSLPAPVIDTSLDDRDSGLCPFGKSGLIVTSFNNTVDFQRGSALTAFKNDKTDAKQAYVDAYLNNVTKEKEAEDLGASFRISFDNGVTFGKIYKSPVTSPHGPCELSDGTVLWVGRTFSKDDVFHEKEDCIKAYEIDVITGKCTFRGQIADVLIDGKKYLSCEPHAIQLPSGKIICHIRVQGDGVYTTYQSISADGGRTWSEPKRIIGITEGAPAHLLVHSSGALISTYGHREANPTFCVKGIVSYDEGETWSEPFVVNEDYSYTPDMGYPESIELSDNSILTIAYCHPEKDGPANIIKQKWRLSK